MLDKMLEMLGFFFPFILIFIKQFYSVSLQVALM